MTTTFTSKSCKAEASASMFVSGRPKSSAESTMLLPACRAVTRACTKSPQPCLASTSPQLREEERAGPVSFWAPFPSCYLCNASARLLQRVAASQTRAQGCQSRLSAAFPQSSRWQPASCWKPSCGVLRGGWPKACALQHARRSTSPRPSHCPRPLHLSRGATAPARNRPSTATQIRHAAQRPVPVALATS